VAWESERRGSREKVYGRQREVERYDRETAPVSRAERGAEENGWPGVCS